MKLTTDTVAGHELSSQQVITYRGKVVKKLLGMRELTITGNVSNVENKGIWHATALQSETGRTPEIIQRIMELVRKRQRPTGTPPRDLRRSTGRKNDRQA